MALLRLGAFRRSDPRAAACGVARRPRPCPRCRAPVRLDGHALQDAPTRRPARSPAGDREADADGKAKEGPSVDGRQGRPRRGTKGRRITGGLGGGPLLLPPSFRLASLVFLLPFPLSCYVAPLRCAPTCQLTRLAPVSHMCGAEAEVLAPVPCAPRTRKHQPDSRAAPPLSRRRRRSTALPQTYRARPPCATRMR